MRIDLPYCGFKNCQYWFDGNCTKQSEQGKCDYWYILHEEPERRKGKWIVKTDCEGKTRTCICGLCGYTTDKYTWKNPNYCPNCGSDMREIEN